MRWCFSLTVNFNIFFIVLDFWNPDFDVSWTGFLWISDIWSFVKTLGKFSAVIFWALFHPLSFSTSGLQRHMLDPLLWFHRPWGSVQCFVFFNYFPLFLNLSNFSCRIFQLVHWFSSVSMLLLSPPICFLFWLLYFFSSKIFIWFLSHFLFIC